MRLIFARLDEKTFEDFQNFLKKIAKMSCFSIFQKINKPCVKFWVFGRKEQIVGNFEKTLKSFDEISI